jgi:hypothetical protein
MRAARYDPRRAQARLALLEEQGMLADTVRDRDEIISRDLFPLIDDRQRNRHLAALEPAIAAGQRAVDELAAVAGDPEMVCDERGWLPAERRDLSLRAFKDRRAAEIRQLRTSIPARQAELKTLTGRSERAALREALRRDAARLASLEAMAPMQAGDMCSECVSPGLALAGRHLQPRRHEFHRRPVPGSATVGAAARETAPRAARAARPAG